MLASPTWPSSYLREHKYTLKNIYIFFIKGHHCDFYLNVPPSAIPSHYNDFQGRKPPILCVVLYSAHINSLEQKKKQEQKHNTEPWFEFDTMPSQIEFPT